MDITAPPLPRCHPRTRCTSTSLLVVVLVVAGAVTGSAGQRNTCTLETRQSAEQGNPVAAFRLAVCLQTVYGVDKASVTSSKLEPSAAQLQDKTHGFDDGDSGQFSGPGRAGFGLASLSLHLPLPPPALDPNSAIAWMEYSAELGYTRAIYQAAVWRDHVGDHSRAAAWYLQAAASGHTASQHDIAVCYKLGVGVEKSVQVSPLSLALALLALDLSDSPP